MTPRLRALRFQRDFLARLGPGLQVAELFGSLPMVAFFAKDESSRFVRANEALVRILCCRHEWEVIGKTDLDFRPPEVAATYIEEDRRVMRTGRAVSPHIQMVPDVGGAIRWQVVSKVPLRDARGRVCGVAGAMHEISEVAGVLQPFRRLQPALSHIHDHFRERLSARDLAALAHMSERHLVRLFRRWLGVPPMRYLVRQRIRAAAHALITTDHTAGTIALDCGFYDQSAFTHAFRAHVGLAPAAYRRNYGATPEALAARPQQPSSGRRPPLGVGG